MTFGLVALAKSTPPNNLFVQTGPGAHPASCTMGTGSFPGVKSGRSLTLTPYPFLVPRSWKKGRSIPLLPLCAVRPVQRLSACTRVHFTLPQCLYKGALYLTSVPVQGCTLPYLSACTRVYFTLQWLNGKEGEGTEKVGEKMAAAAGSFEETYIWRWI